MHKNSYLVRQFFYFSNHLGYLLVKQSERRRKKQPPAPTPLDDKVDSGPPSSWRSALVKTGFFTLGLPAVLAGLSFIGLPVAQVGNTFYYFFSNIYLSSFLHTVKTHGLSS
jgi:hypothetical protein